MTSPFPCSPVIGEWSWKKTQIEKKYSSNATDAGNDQSMFILTILEKVKETRLKFSQGSETVL